MFAKSLIVGLVAAVTARSVEQVPAASLSYSGTLSAPGYAVNVPLNVTVTGATAEFAYVWDKNAGGEFCVPDTLTGLVWSVSGTEMTAMGTGKDPAFYSFKGSVSADGKTITGDMYDPPHVGGGAKAGTFTLTKGAPGQPSKCKKPLPPPPPPAPRATTRPFIWPLPSTYTNGSTAAAVSPGADFFSTDSTSDFLTQAFERYTKVTFPHVSTGSAAGGITGLAVSVESTDDSYPQVETDESYELTVGATGKATLKARTVYGALRGLETFSQLVMFDFDTASYVVAHAPWSITDVPRFPHRGLMIDSARHFETLASIRTIIDSLPYAKLNVLHWHMVDTQSFPFQSKTYPKLWDGSWSPVEKYTQADIADVIEYAKMRGVRVMVEFDMPGHGASWCTGYPDICPSPTCLQPLNVASNKTFELIESLLNECTGGVDSKPGKPSPGLFKSNMIHLGGDEVDTSCWASTPEVAAWLKAKNMTPDDGYAYFVKRVAGIAMDQGHRPVQWSEVYDHFKDTLPKETIIHIWKSVTNVTEPLAGGYNALVNVGYDKLSWYLDNLNVMWDAVYMNEPCAGVPDHLCPMVLGGHGEMWGETVDASDIQGTVWPRMAAIAERLWSPREINSTADAHERIESFRCLLNRRGIGAAPVNNANARSAPPGPGSCLQQ